MIKQQGWGGGYLLPGDICNNIRQPVAEVLQEKHPNTRVPPVENTTCTDFDKYEDVSKTVPLYFTEDDVTWVVSNHSGATGELRDVVTELRNWLMRFV